MQQTFGFVPAEAGIGDGDAMKQGHAFFPGLPAGIEVAFDHQPHDGLPTFTELSQDFAGDEALARGVFLGIVMRAIDHNRSGDTFSGNRGLSLSDLFLLIVRPSAPAAQDDVTVWIAHGSDDRGLAIGVDADEMMWGAGRNHRIDGNLQAAFSPILEADWHGHAAGHFAMSLAFSRTGPDRRPTDEVGDVLRADRVQQFRSARKTQLIDSKKNRSCQLHPRRDVAGAVEARVVDEAFPADGGSWLFKVRPHDDQETVMQGIGNRFQFGGIFIGGFGVMDGARADDHQKAISVLPMEDSSDCFSGFNDERRRLIGNGQFGLDGAGRRERLDFDNVLIVDWSTHEPSRL